VPLVSGIALPLPTAAVGRASWASTAGLGGGPVVHHDLLFPRLCGEEVDQPCGAQHAGDCARRR